ncbi:hypothetical protein AAVH_31341 [Aphelenchoides avenae]|nr:hypothetical protein AAVH_31341 [Aphelenchus avenae]
MTFELEVDTAHGHSFYEIRAQNLDTIQGIFVAHSSSKSLDIIVNSSASIVKNGKQRPLMSLDFSLFRQLRRIRRLNLDLNHTISLRCPVPFSFHLTHLTLSKCVISAYDFAVLLNCVGESLTHLTMEEVRIEDADEDPLSELIRCSNLRHLRIDKDFDEVCQLLPRVLSRCLDTLCVRKASLLDLFRADLTRLTTTLAADVLTIDDVGFSVKDIGRLEGVLRSHVHNKAFIKKYGARAANGGSKVNFVLGLSKDCDSPNEAAYRSLYKFGAVEILVYIRPVMKFGVPCKPSADTVMRLSNFSDVC